MIPSVAGIRRILAVSIALLAANPDQARAGNLERLFATRAEPERHDKDLQ